MHYCLHRSTPLFLILIQTNPVHPSYSDSLKYILILSSHLFIDPPHQIHAWLLLLVILQFIALVVCAEWFTSCSYTLCDIIQSPVTSSPLDLAVFRRRDNHIFEEFLSILTFQNLCKHLTGNLYQGEILQRRIEYKVLKFHLITWYYEVINQPFNHLSESREIF